MLPEKFPSPVPDPETQQLEQIRAELDIVARRELVVGALNTVHDLLDVEVSVPLLLEQATEEDDDIRVKAVRALRCITAIGRENSQIVAAVGEKHLYHYVEAVVQYGAADHKYLAIMEKHGLSAEEATGLYALREVIQETLCGASVGFGEIEVALERLGISFDEVRRDPESVAATMEAAGYMFDHIGRKVLARPALNATLAEKRIPLGPDMDSVPLDSEAVQIVEELKSRLDEFGESDD